MDNAITSSQDYSPFQLIGLVSSIVIGLTGLMYLMGWYYYNSYFDGLRVQWQLNFISSTNLLLGGSNYVAAVVIPITASITLANIQKTALPTNRMVSISTAYFCIGSIIFVSGIFIQGSYFMFASCFAMSASAGMHFTRTVNSTSMRDMHFMPQIRAMLFIGCWIVIMSAPIVQGTNDSIRDKDRNSSHLPIIRIKTDNRSDLRLLYTDGERFFYFEPVKDSIIKLETCRFDEVEYVKGVK